MSVRVRPCLPCLSVSVRVRPCLSVFVRFGPFLVSSSRPRAASCLRVLVVFSSVSVRVGPCSSVSVLLVLFVPFAPPPPSPYRSAPKCATMRLHTISTKAASPEVAPHERCPAVGYAPGSGPGDGPSQDPGGGDPRGRGQAGLPRGGARRPPKGRSAIGQGAQGLPATATTRSATARRASTTWKRACTAAR